MNYLLDTNILLWWLLDDLRLSATIRTIVANTNNIIFVSSASTWEISIKSALGKLTVINCLEERIKQCGFTGLPISVIHSIAAGKLPKIHSDPFDRMLIAQSITENLKIITSDLKILQYEVNGIKV